MRRKLEKAVFSGVFLWMTTLVGLAMAGDSQQEIITRIKGYVVNETKYGQYEKDREERGWELFSFGNSREWNISRDKTIACLRNETVGTSSDPVCELVFKNSHIKASEICPNTYENFILESVNCKI